MFKNKKLQCIYEKACGWFITVVLFTIAFCVCLHLLSWFVEFAMPLVDVAVNYFYTHLWGLAALLFCVFMIAFVMSIIINNRRKTN